MIFFIASVILLII